MRINLLIEKTAANKHSDIFLIIIHDICKIVNTIRCFSYIYIPYQIYKKWSCWTFYHSLNRFPQGNDNRVSTFWKWFIIEVYTRSTLFYLNWLFLNFLDFYEKTLVERKRFAKIILANKKNPGKNWKYSGKKQNFRSHLSRFKSFET